MTRLDHDDSGLRERIRKARLERSSVADGRAEVDLGSAYRIQAALGEGRLTKGYKVVPFTRHADTLVYGHVYSDSLLTPPVSLASFLRPRIAVRLAVVLARDVPAGARPGLVELALGGRFLALEITDSVWADEELTLAGAVADNASVGGVVVSERLLQPPLWGEAVLRVDGTPLLAHPLGAFDAIGEHLVWLAGQVGGLACGQIVLLGTNGGPEPFTPSPGTFELLGPDGSMLTVAITP
jgi:2-keto-4-pentenoate hydratase